MCPICLLPPLLKLAGKGADHVSEMLPWGELEKLLYTHHFSLSKWEVSASEPSTLLMAKMPSTISTIHMCRANATSTAS